MIVKYKVFAKVRSVYQISTPMGVAPGDLHEDAAECWVDVSIVNKIKETTCPGLRVSRLESLCFQHFLPYMLRGHSRSYSDAVS